jgi:hypothetical protein
MRCMGAPNDVIEVATRRESVRRALLTEADEPQLRTTQLQNAFHRLTLELSRPVAVRRTRASVAQSTRLTPRHGVGLNELLGGGGCRLKPNPDALAERRSGEARTRTCELSAGCNRSDRISSGEHDDTKHRCLSRHAQRMRSVSAPHGLGRRSNVPRT